MDSVERIRGFPRVPSIELLQLRLETHLRRTIASAGLTRNERVNWNLLNDALFLMLSEIKIHACCQHQVTLEKKANASHAHFSPNV